mmetsp:Transcript_74218/g.172154  ORF Transcript_74218/g.172154 Transcript_74218/m.172154 type:complete len:264 (+) Transcript_74218:246-1037(+)
MTQVMLSPPRPCVSRGSAARQESSKASMILGISSPCFSLGPTKSQTSWLVFTSQTPSQASTMNSSSSVMGSRMTSGVEQIICLSGPRSDLFLYSMSPIARERFRFPLTRWWTLAPTGISSTRPPAASMRSRSVPSFGLWSWESSTGRPVRHMMARESPALAQTTSVSDSRMHTAVHPTLSAAPASGFSAGPWFSRRLSNAIFIMTWVASSLLSEPRSRACAKSDWIEFCKKDKTRGFGTSPSSSLPLASPSAEGEPELRPAVP